MDPSSSRPKLDQQPDDPADSSEEELIEGDKDYLVGLATYEDIVRKEAKNFAVEENVAGKENLKELEKAAVSGS